MAKAKASPDSSAPLRSGGRPRSEPTRLAILEATMKLLGQATLDDISIEAIAKESGASKATIYRWWESKASVVIDAFIESHILKTPIERNIPIRDAIAHHMASLIRQYSGQPGRIAAQIIAAGQSDERILQEFRERFHYGRRAVVRELLTLGKRTGELNADFDPEFVMDVIYAPIYMRLMLGHGPLDEAFAQQLSNTTLPLLDQKLKSDAVAPLQKTSPPDKRRPQRKEALRSKNARGT